MNRKLTKLDLKELTTLAAAGESNVQIGRRLGVSTYCIRKNRKDLGIPSSKNIGGRPKILTQREERRLIREFEAERIETSTQGAIFVKSRFEKKISTH